MRDRINKCCARRAHDLEDGPLYLCQRFSQVENNPVNQQIAKLQEEIEWLQRNNSPQNVAVWNMLEETESPLSEDIKMTSMPSHLKLPDLKYDGTGNPAEYLETYKS